MSSTARTGLPAKRLVLAGLGAMVLLHALVFLRLRREIVSGYPDFTIFYTAGKCVREGQGQRLYDPAVQQALQQRFASGVQRRYSALPYNHAPYEALLFAPLAAFSYSTAYWLWGVINVGLLIAFWRLARRRLPELNRFFPGLPLLAALAFFPVFVALLQGQDSILLLVLCTLTWLGLGSGRDFAAGACLAAGLFKPQLVLPLVAVLALRRRWRALAGFAAAGIALFLVSAGVVGWQGVLGYPEYMLRLNAHLASSGIDPLNMPNLRGLAFSFLGDSKVAMGLTAAGSAALLVFAAWKWKELRSDLGFALAMTVTVMVSYHLLAHDMSLLLLALLPAAEWLCRSEQGPRRLLFAAMGLLFFSPLYFVLGFRYQRLSVMVVVVGMLAAGLSMAMGGRRELAQHASPQG